jgi:DNA-binding CsgD family transcriptional regulator
MAVLLQITPRTVKFHQANILEKLGVESRSDLLRLVY